MRFYRPGRFSVTLGGFVAESRNIQARINQPMASQIGASSTD